MSLVLVTALLPVFCTVVLLVLAFSGQPILFWQERMGHGKKPFKMLKFRTMRHDAEKEKKKLLKYNEAPQPMFKMRNDPRFTKVGRFLSRTGLDELPQFFHVLTGKMSFIGPRPLPIKEAQKLPKDWDFRYNIKPGIISHWAVATDRYTSLKRWRELDQQTVDTGSLRSDMKLIGQCFYFLLPSKIKALLKKSRVGAGGTLPRISSQNTTVVSRKRAPLRSFVQ